MAVPGDEFDQLLSWRRPGCICSVRPKTELYRSEKQGVPDGRLRAGKGHGVAAAKRTVVSNKAAVTPARKSR